MTQDSILVAGYPLGGDSLSITKGIVSRVTMTRYTHASHKLLGIQIDAAINPGNSGGPSFTDLQHGKAGACACSVSRPEPLCRLHRLRQSRPPHGVCGGATFASCRRHLCKTPQWMSVSGVCSVTVLHLSAAAGARRRCQDACPPHALMISAIVAGCWSGLLQAPECRQCG